MLWEIAKAAFYLLVGGCAGFFMASVFIVGTSPLGEDAGAWKSEGCCEDDTQ
ncbi:hypothetical protein UFOVP119_16 [uncultured Caudovirales phage]|uniref:Uncharacterized protein n=1 Tax=uncultured Caudovirales phage TaxID=2100421 RepID=A0A6J5LAF9_9CAUD|nr:hypothetical protein UFOVP119_16 [uncultured Caudovirales phage]